MAFNAKSRSSFAGVFCRCVNFGLGSFFSWKQASKQSLVENETFTEVIYAYLVRSEIHDLVPTKHVKTVITLYYTVKWSLTPKVDLLLLVCFVVVCFGLGIFLLVETSQQTEFSRKLNLYRSDLRLSCSIRNTRFSAY